MRGLSVWLGILFLRQNPGLLSGGGVECAMYFMSSVQGVVGWCLLGGLAVDLMAGFMVSGATGGL